MKDMELYDSFIRETTDLLGAPTQKWAYKERDAWKDNGESELVLLRDAAYELGGGANDAVNFTCVTSDSSLVPADEVLLYGPDMKEIKGDVPFARLVILGVKDIDVEQKDATYAAIRNIEFVKYHVFPDGYMMRVSPESSREQIRVSKKAIKKGGLGPCAANGANEEAVKLFLEDKIGFLDIGRLVEAVVDSDSFGGDYSLADVYECDRMARAFVRAHL